MAVLRQRLEDICAASLLAAPWQRKGAL